MFASAMVVCGYLFLFCLGCALIAFAVMLRYIHAIPERHPRAGTITDEVYYRHPYGVARGHDGTSIQAERHRHI